jgi:hypothetical protein
MQKSRYKFVHHNKAILYDAAKLSTYRKELSLFVKELYIYNITFKNLAKGNPRPIIKDELLNLAIICTESDSITKWIKLHRSLPIKELSSISGKPQKFFERWENYIIAFFIIIHNNYSCIYSFLNIKSIDPFSKDINDTNPNKEEGISGSGEIVGIILKVKSKACYILTPDGSFASIRVSRDVSPGELCSGEIKKERDYYKVPAKIFIAIFAVTLIAYFYLYNLKDRTIIIRGNLSMKMETNKWDRVISLTALNSSSYQLKKDSKTFNKSLDSVLVSLLQSAVYNNYINDKNPSTIYISGAKTEYPDIIKTKQYIEDNKLQVTIIYNVDNSYSEIQ